MSDAKAGRPDVPTGECRFLTTEQMNATDKGFVGYKTTWEEFQKEAKYEKPKNP